MVTGGRVLFGTHLWHPVRGVRRPAAVAACDNGTTAALQWADADEPTSRRAAALPFVLVGKRSRLQAEAVEELKRLVGRLVYSGGAVGGWHLKVDRTSTKPPPNRTVQRIGDSVSVSPVSQVVLFP